MSAKIIKGSHMFFHAFNICQVLKKVFEQEVDRPSAQTSPEGPDKC